MSGGKNFYPGSDVFINKFNIRDKELLEKFEIQKVFAEFFYGEDEKAYKTCYKLVKKVYPHANYRIEKGHGHMTYSCEYTDEYVNWLQDIIEAK